MARKSIKQQLVEAGIEDRSAEIENNFRNSITKAKSSPIADAYTKDSAEIQKAANRIFAEILEDLCFVKINEETFQRQLDALSKNIREEVKRIKAKAHKSL